jgi:uncharacterized Ntn-hydrolase superfamily protein
MKTMSSLFLAFCLSASSGAGFAQQDPLAPVSAPHISTFSIVAQDPETGDYGVAVQSRYFAVGAVVPHAAAETGAIATQALGNLLYGPQGLALLAEGKAADEVIEQLVKTDPLRTERQVGVVDQQGRAASYTGKDCLPWAGGRTGDHYAVQGNLLAGPQVVNAMATAFEAAPGDFATRLVYSLAAGQAAGGDARGRQSAALLVVRKEGGYLGLTDRYIDLHVEDHPTPIRELARLLEIRQSQLAHTRARELLKRAEDAEEDQRADLYKEANVQVEHALELYPEDDYGWWMLARIRLLQGEQDAAAEAAQRALIENPTWRRLPESTRASLGVAPALVTELLEIDTFRRVWESLAPETSAVAQ